MKKYAYYLYILITSACASVAMPTGGPKDETPPELENSNPANNQKNFQGKSIELNFNEDIKLKDPKEEILITPSIGKDTKYIAKKRKVIIEPQLELSENTTYSFNFREGIQDLTEGNPAENLRLAFSTGPTIDSLYIFGKVDELLSDKLPQKITVALYQADTFNIFNHIPIYFTKSDKKGVFSIQNLKAGSYYIYAFDDKNKNLKVDSKTEKFGYLSNALILPNENKDTLNISLITVDARPLAISALRHTDKTTRLRFNKQIDSLKVISLDKSQATYTYGENKAELIFYQEFNNSDSVKVRIVATDSTNQKIDSTIFLKYSESKTAQETFRTKEVTSRYYPLTKTFTHVLSYSKPLSKILYDSIVLHYDSIHIRTIAPDKIIIDTLNKVLTLTTPIELIVSEGSKKPLEPSLIYNKAGLISIENDSSKSMKVKIPIIDEEETGTILIKVETTHQNYSIQLIDKNDNLIESVKNIKNYTFRFVKPDEYKIRVLIDRNNNGMWDAGNFYKKMEPEKIIKYISEEGKPTFPIRANWEYGPLLIKF
jgi:uncharacterized protein (DUF2141 family)